MKKTAALLLALMLSLSGIVPASAAQSNSNEVRGIWVSYLELQNILTNQTAQQFEQYFDLICRNCKSFGLNTIILQVRPFGDAIYPSDYFPATYLFNGQEQGVGQAPFDALEIAVETAHRYGLRLEAWINPYRVRNAVNTRQMIMSNPAVKMLSTGDAIQFGQIISYNPASEAAQDLIVDGVAEIVRNYEVDGIHFDDYFYPTTDEKFDAGWYQAYQRAGGRKSLTEWRQQNVTVLMGLVYTTIKELNPNVTFGLSPQGNNQNNLYNQYVNLQDIIRGGYVDYICPQMYYGFQNAACPYTSTLQQFAEMVRGTRVALCVGLATYKFGNVDTWAGAGKNEWLYSTDILKRQVQTARQMPNYRGFMLYRYDSTFNFRSFFSNQSVWTQVQNEMNQLYSIL